MERRSKREAEVGSIGNDVSMSASKKSKGDTVHDEASTAMLIPPPVWGNILDFLPYSDVRSALLISPVVANEGSKYVETLSMTETSHLDVPASRRFTNVKCVQIFCLLRLRRWEPFELNENDDPELFATMNKDCPPLIVPFLTSFAKLRHVFIGGIPDDEEMRQHRIDRLWTFQPGNLAEVKLFEQLVSSLIGAFKTRALQQNLFLNGIAGRVINGEDWEFRPTERHRCDVKLDSSIAEGSCSLCKGICSMFPVNNVLRLWRHSSVNDHFGLTLSKDDFFLLLRSRPKFDWDALLPFGKDVVKEIFIFHSDCINIVGNDGQCNDSDESIFCERMERALHERGEKCENISIRVHHYDDEVLDRLELMVENGFDPGTLTREAIYRCMNRLSEGDWELRERKMNEPLILLRHMFDRLRSMGFPIEAGDHVIVDKDREPVVRRHFERWCTLNNLGSSR